MNREILLQLLVQRKEEVEYLLKHYKDEEVKTYLARLEDTIRLVKSEVSTKTLLDNEIIRGEVNRYKRLNGVNEKTERTFVMLKPDALANQKVEKRIINRILNKGYKVVKHKKIKLSDDHLKVLYYAVLGKEFYSDMREWLLNDYCLVLVVEGDNAIKGMRDLIGNVREPEEGTIRKGYNDPSTPIHKNLIHGSSDKEAALKELSSFFPELTNGYEVGENRVRYNTLDLSAILKPTEGNVGKCSEEQICQLKVRAQKQFGKALVGVPEVLNLILEMKDFQKKSLGKIKILSQLRQKANENAPILSNTSRKLNSSLKLLDLICKLDKREKEINLNSKREEFLLDYGKNVVEIQEGSEVTKPISARQMKPIDKTN